MTAREFHPQIGDCTIFGFTPDPEEVLKRRLPLRLGVTPRSLPVGDRGHLFFYTSYGDVAESDEAIILKLGFARSPTKSPLSAQQLLDQKIVTPKFANPDALRGNALVVCFSKTLPLFSAFKTLCAIPQLYYWVSDDGIICSDRLRCIVSLMQRAELNSDALPMHFLFRSAVGSSTYIRNVQRLLPGQFFKWKDGDLSVNLIKDLSFADSDISFPRADARSLNILYESLRDVIGDYVAQAKATGQNVANLLSGGVDSSLIQFVLNQKSPARSFSFAARASSFEFEIEYARQASRFFHTEHTFVEFGPEDYPGLLARTIDALAQPPVLATEPSMLAVTEFVDTANLPIRFFFSGQGADALFGLEGAKKLKGLKYLSRIPAAATVLRGIGTFLKPFTASSRQLLKGAEILAHADNPQAYVSPLNTLAVYTDIERLRQCFGDQALRAALEYRRELAAQYRKSNHYLEQGYVMDLVTDAYEVDVQRHQLFLAHHQEQLHPFFDEDILRVGMAFHPDVRYIKGFRTKYLLKDILEQQTGSATAQKPKGFSIFDDDLFNWMQSGPLRQWVDDIQLPGFIGRADYESLIQQPDYFLWGLLLLDIFQKRILSQSS